VTEYELELRESPSQDVVLVEATGELDLTNAADFEQRLDDVSAGGTALVLDLNYVSFIDSAALHVLFRAVGRLGQGHFGIVVDPTAAIARTLEIVGLGDVALIRPSFAELVEELRT
jgi:anti-anti-sigma factor